MFSAGSSTGPVSFKYLRHEPDDQKDNKRILSTCAFRQLFREGEFNLYARITQHTTI